MKWLCIDCTKTVPSFLVAEGAHHFGTLQMLDDAEVKDYAKWLAVYGGRKVFDAFEVALINVGMLRVWPVDEDGNAVYDECDAVAIEHHDDGSRIVWEPKVRCETCCGQGHFVMDDSPVEEEDLCLYCDGDGYVIGGEFETDLDGNLIEENTHA